MTEDIITAEDDNVVVTAGGFDYEALSMEGRITIRARAERIHDRMRRTAQDIVDTGMDLIEVRAKLRAEAKKSGSGDGEQSFQAWVGAEFGWSRRTAYNMMAVAERLGVRANFAHTASRIGSAALYLLAAPSTPDEAIEEAFRRAETADDKLPKAEVEQIIAEHKPAPASRSSSGGGGGGGGGGRSTSTLASPTGSSAPVSSAPPSSSASPATSLPAQATADDEEIAALPTQDATALPATQATPPPTTAPPAPLPPLPGTTPTLLPLASAVAAGVSEQTHLLLCALEQLLNEALQQVRVQLDEARAAGAPLLAADRDSAQQAARMLLDAPAVRGAGAMFAFNLREVERESRDLAWVLRELEAVERQAMPDPLALTELGQALQDLSPVLADRTYEQLALRLERQRQRLERRFEADEGNE